MIITDVKDKLLQIMLEFAADKLYERGHDPTAVSKVQNNRYPVVSVPSGSASAKKYITNELEWLSKFENIILIIIPSLIIILL